MKRLITYVLLLLTISANSLAQDVSNIKVSFGDKVMNVPAASVTSIVPTNRSIAMENLEKEKTCQEALLPNFIAKDKNVSIYWSAMQATGIDKMMQKWIDMTYDSSRYPMMNLAIGARMPEAFYSPNRKEYGFTAFLVTDKTLKEKYNITNLQELAAFAKTIYDKTYPEDAGKYDEDYTNPKNPLHRFIAYHVLDRNVQAYNLLTVREDAGIDVNIVNPTDWYTTLLPHTMLKAEHLTVHEFTDANSVRGDYYLNRRYDNTYQERGTHVSPSVEEGCDNNAVNGMYFYIDDILKFDDTTRDVVDNTRIRMDSSTIFPELQTTNMRMNGTSIGSDNIGKNYYFPAGYLDNVKINDGRFLYAYANSGYWDLSGDEISLLGTYDVEFNLPPVPFTGEWQLRIGGTLSSSVDGINSGIMQVYIDGIEAGILNLSENLAKIYGNTQLPNYSNIREDAELRLKDFYFLKGKGTYRAPYSAFNSKDGTINTMYSRMSDIRNMARKVLFTGYLSAGITHTVRLKNATGYLPIRVNFNFDYLELVPKSVYDGVEDDL